MLTTQAPRTGNCDLCKDNRESGEEPERSRHCDSRRDSNQSLGTMPGKALSSASGGMLQPGNLPVRIVQDESPDHEALIVRKALLADRRFSFDAHYRICNGLILSQWRVQSPAGINAPRGYARVGNEDCVKTRFFFVEIRFL